MNNKVVKELSKDQAELVAEFSVAYGIDPSQILFFEGDAKPLFEHEANAILCRRIGEAVGIENEPTQSVFPESIAVKCRMTWEDGQFASSVGIAYLNETIDGEAMSPEQLLRLATSRAVRNTLVDAGVDLVKIHYRKTRNVTDLSGHKQKSLREKLLAEVHVLGKETGYIVMSRYEGDLGPVPFKDKAGWERMLETRYGVKSSGVLSDELLADLSAFLKTQLPQQQKLAA